MSIPHTKITVISTSTLKLCQLWGLYTKAKSNSIQTTKPSHLRPLQKNRGNSDPCTEIKSISIPHTTIKFISTTHIQTNATSTPTQNPVIFDPNTTNKSISITHKKPSQSILTLERSHFRPAHNNPVNFGPHTKTKCMSINHTKDNSIPTSAMISSLFRSPTIKSSQSLPPKQNPSQFRCPD